MGNCLPCRHVMSFTCSAETEASAVTAYETRMDISNIPNMTEQVISSRLMQKPTASESEHDLVGLKWEEINKFGNRTVRVIHTVTSFAENPLTVTVSSHLDEGIWEGEDANLIETFIFQPITDTTTRMILTVHIAAEGNFGCVAKILGPCYEHGKIRPMFQAEWEEYAEAAAHREKQKETTHDSGVVVPSSELKSNQTA